MNIVKITKALMDYIDCVKEYEVPDVHDLYCKLGFEGMGRHVYLRGEPGIDYFNKCTDHKKYPSYIGEWCQGFYAQTIAKMKEEKRVFVMCGRCNTNDEEIIELARRVQAFRIDDFVLDVWRSSPDSPWKVLEVNEIHLSSVKPSELQFFYENLL